MSVHKIKFFTMVDIDTKKGKKKGEKIHLGDWPAVKRAIDDQVIEVCAAFEHVDRSTM